VSISQSGNESPEPGDYGTSLKGQLDLFARSRTVILINDLVDCLLKRNAARVRERLDLLAEAPGHPALDALGTLREGLERWPAPLCQALVRQGYLHSACSSKRMASTA